MNRQIRIVGISLLALLLAPIARAQAPATAQAATGPTIEPKAAAVLHKMADFYKATKSASAKIDTQIKTTGGPGGPAGNQQMQSVTTLAVERPNKIAITVTEQQSGGGAGVSDGQTLPRPIARLEK